MCVFLCVWLFCVCRPRFFECFFGLWDRCEFRSSFSLFLCCFCVRIAICVCLVRRRRCSVCSRVARCVFRRCLRPAVRVVAFSFCLCMLLCCLLASFFVRAIFSFVLHSVVCSGRASGSSFSLRVPRLSLSVSSWNRTSFRVL